MKIIRPYPVNGDVLEATSIPGDDYTEWSPGTYAKGATAKVGEVAYEALAETSDSPEEGLNATPRTWLRLGYINRWRMFRAGVDSLTSAPASITIELRFTQLINAVALFNVTGLSARVQMIDDLDGVVYDAELELTDPGVGTWYDWYFQPYRTFPDHVLEDLPPYIGAKLIIEIEGATAEDIVSIGRVACGQILELGLTQWGLEVGTLDASIFDRDGFGHLDIVPRRKVPTAKFMVSVDTPETSRIKRELDAISEPVVAIGAPQYGLTLIYGIVRDARIILPNLHFSDLAIEVEGF